MSSIKEKFTRGFKKNHVDANEPVKTSVSDDDSLRYYEPPIPVEDLLAESARLAAEKAKGKKLETSCRGCLVHRHCLQCLPLPIVRHHLRYRHRHLLMLWLYEVLIH